MSRVLPVLLIVNAALGQSDPVRVREVNFAREELTGRGGDWLEVEVALEGFGNPAPEARNPRFADRVKVMLMLGYANRENPPAFTFFRSEATVVSIGEAGRVSVYFYLPPEVLDRDRLKREPYAYLVELEVDGRSIPLRRSNVSATLSDGARASTFRARAKVEAAPNEGVLLPIYQTPFYHLPAKLSRSPGYIRGKSE